MVILSHTVNPPYQPVGDRLPLDSIYLTGKSDFETIYTETKHFFLIVEDDWYDEIEIRVENETETGYSFYISTVDLLDKPQKWTKQITYTNVYAKHTRFIQKIVYRWAVINNIFLLTQACVNRPRPHADINVYGVRYINT